MITELAVEGGTVWRNVSEPAPEELAELIREAGLSSLDGSFVAQNQHRPEVAVGPDYILILIHVPTFNKQTRVTSGIPLYFVIKQDQVWTVHHRPLVVLANLIEDWDTVAERREEHLHQDAVTVALELINEMYGSAFKKLQRLSKHADIAEDAVFHGNERKMVEEISMLRRDVMDFRKIIRPQTTLFALPPQHNLLTLEGQTSWLRLNGQTQKLWEFLEGLEEGTAELASTNANLLQHKENELLRLLTYYSVIGIPSVIVLTPLDPLSSDSPLLERIFFWSLLGLLIIMLVTIFLRFRGKRVL